VGLPPFHTYTLLRRASLTEGWHSVTLNGELDGYEDADVERRQTYTYRLVLWGLYGDSPGTEVAGCRAGAGKSKAAAKKAAHAAAVAGGAAEAEEEGGWAYALFMSALMVVLPLMVRHEQLWRVAGAWLGASPTAPADAAPVTEEELAAAAAAAAAAAEEDRWLAGAFVYALRLFSRIASQSHRDDGRSHACMGRHVIEERLRKMDKAISITTWLDSAFNSSHPMRGRC